MARNVGIKIESNLEEVLKEKGEAVARALEKVGLVAEGHAKTYCPVDTGRLRNSISHDADDTTAYVGTNVEYAADVEMGTSHQKEQPYLEPAIMNHINEYKQIIEEELKS